MALVRLLMFWKIQSCNCRDNNIQNKYNLFQMINTLITCIIFKMKKLSFVSERPIGHIAHRETVHVNKNFRAKLWEYHNVIYCQGGIITIFLRTKLSFICENLCVLHTRTNFGWNWSCCSSGEHFKFCQCLFAILLLSPLGKWCDPSFERNWIPFTQASFVSSLLKLAKWF